MAWNLKQKAQDHIVSIGLGLIVLLLLVIWRAVDPSVWGRVSEATPKQVLWALIALELIAIGLLGAFAIDNRRKSKHTPTAPEPPKYYEKFGVMWDAHFNPHCPVCLTLMHVTDRYISQNSITHEEIRCPRCKTELLLEHDGGYDITLVEARKEVEALVRMAEN